MDRATVVQIIKDLADTLAQPEAAAAPPGPRAERPTEESDALREVCGRHGVSVADYKAALRGDPALADLEKQALLESLGAPDPGPNDAISRESPSGQPGDLTKPRSVPRREAPGGS